MLSLSAFVLFLPSQGSPGHHPMNVHHTSWTHNIVSRAVCGCAIDHRSIRTILRQSSSFQAAVRLENTVVGPLNTSLSMMQYLEVFHMNNFLSVHNRDCSLSSPQATAIAIISAKLIRYQNS